MSLPRKKVIQMNRDLLPIGSVVEVPLEQTPLLMVIGYFPQTETDSADYLVVPYPVGALLENAALLIDEADVSKVIHRGYLDDFGREVLAEASELASLESDYRLE